MGIELHKEIGYDIMECFQFAFLNSDLVDVNDSGCYQKLTLSNKCSIRYTKWRDSKMPYYIILYNQKGKYIFELDLSMLLYEKNRFQWHLKNPTNESTYSVLEANLGRQVRFSNDYVKLVKQQKAVLNSGVQTPQKGFHFIESSSWAELTKKITNLVVSVFDVHGTRMSCNELAEAEDDDENPIIGIRRGRKGQRKLRLNLLELYEGKCAITGYAPTEVLEAAHIIDHAVSGINSSKNGLLLRADIHSLFDSNLLRIKPKSYKIVIDSSLYSTPYWKLNGLKLRDRIDGSTPSKEYLKKRWDS